MKPQVNMHFVTLPAAFNFYSRYGTYNGFNTRRGGDRKDKQKLVLFKYLVCSKEGHKYENEESEGDDMPIPEKKRKRLYTRTYCPSMISLKYTAGGGYYIQKFIQAHNHE